MAYLYNESSIFFSNNVIKYILNEYIIFITTEFLILVLGGHNFLLRFLPVDEKYFM